MTEATRAPDDFRGIVLRVMVIALALGLVASIALWWFREQLAQFPSSTF